jgi:hypothetical protein
MLDEDTPGRHGTGRGPAPLHLQYPAGRILSGNLQFPSVQYGRSEESMNKLPLKAKLFTKVSYVKSEPRIAVAPCEQVIPIGDPDSDFEGNITLVYETVEELGMSVNKFRFESLPCIAAAYEHLRKTCGEKFEEFLRAATCAAIEQRCSEFPMCFPGPKPVNQS